MIQLQTMCSLIYLFDKVISFFLCSIEKGYRSFIPLNSHTLMHMYVYWSPQFKDKIHVWGSLAHEHYACKFNIKVQILCGKQKKNLWNIKSFDNELAKKKV